MADQSDVEQTLAGIVAGVLYPQGPGGPCAIGSACRVHRGWPSAATLDADLLAGTATVTVTGDAQHQRTTTRYPDGWRALRATPVTLTVSIESNVVTFAGEAAPGQLVGLLVNGVAAVHRTMPGDTPTSVAGALAAALQALSGPLGATNSQDASVRVPAGFVPIARVLADQPSVRETRRQMQAFRVICWCPNSTSRDGIASTIDTALSAYDFLGLPDGMAGRLRYLGSTSTDRAQAASLYRRDLIYSVDYATTISADLPRLLFGDVRVIAGGVLAKTILS